MYLYSLNISSLGSICIFNKINKINQIIKKIIIYLFILKIIINYKSYLYYRMEIENIF